MISFNASEKLKVYTRSVKCFLTEFKLTHITVIANVVNEIRLSWTLIAFTSFEVIMINEVGQKNI